MISKIEWLITGDTHGHVAERLDDILVMGYAPDKTNVIILGDCGLNYWLNKSDLNNKKRVSARGFNIWCIHGNHETRASDIPTIQWAYDEEVKGIVGTEPDFPNIHYFKDDVSEYTINGYKCLVIPGAFSVDGEYRRQKTLSNGWCGWFSNEQLSQQEMKEGMKLCSDKTYDFVLSHTCPLSWAPQDLFLPMIDQSKVDHSMENYLEIVQKNIKFKVWCFGHYHKDRLELPRVMQFYQEFATLQEILDFWQEYDETGHLPNPYCEKSPNFYME